MNELDLFRESCRAFVQKELSPLNSPDEFSDVQIHQLSQMGFWNLVDDELGLVPLAIAVEEVARKCPSTALMISIHNCLVLKILKTHGSDEQKKTWLSLLQNGERLGSFALTEHHAGSDAFMLETTATEEKEGWVLNGQKAWVTHVNERSLCIVFAREPGTVGPNGISLFMVPFDSPGVLIEPNHDLLGMNGLNTSTVEFKDVALPAHALLGTKGAGSRLGLEALIAGRLGVSAQALGLAESAFEGALKYSKEREQFNRPISDNQGIQWMFSEVGTVLSAARLLLDRALNEDSTDMYASALAKWVTTDAAMRTSTQAIQIHGGYGYMKEFPFERMYRDAKVTQIYGGANDIHVKYIAKKSISKNHQWLEAGPETPFLNQFKQWVEKHILSHVSKSSCNPEQSQIHMEEMAKQGWATLAVPEQSGGVGITSEEFASAMIMLAETCASTAVVFSVTNMVLSGIARFGNEQQKKEIIPRFRTGEWHSAAFALTESGSGSDAASMKMTAELQDDLYILNGTKLFITSGDSAQLILVFAKTAPDEISAFLVPQDTTGLRIGKTEEKMGLWGSSTVELIFSNCKVPKIALLGSLGQGFKIALSQLDGGRISVAAQAVGIAQLAHKETITYALNRRQGGRKIAQHGQVKQKLAEMTRSIELSRLLIFHAARLKDSGKPFTKEASMAKLFATESCNTLCIEAAQIWGAEGLKETNPISRCIRDVKVTTLYEGTSEIQRWVIARHILKA